MKKGILSFLLAIGICFSFISCVQSFDPEVNKEQEKQEEPKPNPSPDDNPQLQEGLYLYNNEMNPSYDSRTKALDSIFNPDELGEMVLVIDRSEWNKHLEYCDIDIEHEESVIAKGFYFAKDSKQWFFKDVGFRIRGNTSRRKPQDSAGNYIQSHFAIDFEEWLTDEDKAANLDKKLAKSMRGVMLKRFKDDATYSREVYGYNLFRKNKIWIAPRAAYTTLKIQIVDDLDLDKDGDIKEFETVNYGVYGMIEEIKKRFLAERTEKQGGGNFVGNNGNLWKCTLKGCKPNFVKNEATSIGEESIEPVKDEKGNVIQFKKETFAYDYKGDNTLAEGKTQLLAFMEELNNLPNCNESSSASDIQKVKEFFTNKMDGDLFLRTYAINVILGMNDDYWVNNNNFYFYFDEDGKGYFIPYDYDNILGVSCVSNFDVGTKNPMEWGSLTDGQHPLIQKILNVPEYMDLYKSYLDLYSNEQSYFDDDKSIAQITNWQSMIQNYINSPDLKYEDTTSSFEDKVADWCRDNCDVDYKIYTPSSLNYFTVRQKAIKSFLNPSSEKLTLTINAGEGTFESGKNTITCEVNALDTIQDIMQKNAIGLKFKEEAGISYVYKKDGYYYYPDCFVDEKGNKVETSVALFDSIVLNVKYKKWIPVVLNFNGGTWDDESSITTYILENDKIDYVPYKEGYVFAGWTATKDGTDYIDTIGDKDITIYAKWVLKSEVKSLYEYSQDNTKVTFIFRPADFGYNWPSSANYTVRLMSKTTGWSYNNDYHFTKQDDGTYTITLNYSEIQEGFGGWAGFKFYVKETDDWLGPNKYIVLIAPEQIIYGNNPNDPDFKFKLLQPKLTLDLNGGNIGESTDAISFPTNEIQGMYMNDVLEKIEIGYEEPTRGGYVFAGWTYTKDGEDFETYIPSGVATLYARWIEPVECVLTINTGEYGYIEVWDEETSSFIQKTTMDIAFTAGDMLWDVVGKVNISGKTDSDGMYSFTGWYSYKDNLGEKDIIESETRLTSSLTLYPVMQYNKKVSVILDANGGYFEGDEQSIPYEGYETEYLLNYAPTREGYTFVTWAESIVSGNCFKYLSAEMEGKTFYAIWIKDDNFFKDYRIIGDMGGDYDLMPNEDDTVSYTLVYSNEFGNWGGGNGLLNFKIRKDWDWDYSYGCGSVALNGDYTKCVFNGNNIKVSGLKDGYTYKITFKYEDESVWVKIAETSAE